MILMVGLGNPGKKYIESRHNLGFMVVRRLAKELGVKFRYILRLEADIARKRTKTKDILLVLPQAFMNNSGKVVRKLLKNKKIATKNILVVYDDLDLDFGKMRMRPKGSAAGHKGIKSIIQELNTQDFGRIKIGIGRPESGMSGSDYVLSEFSSEEKEELPPIIDKAVRACLCWVEEGIDTAMAKFN
jgi:PTH1 family peptidyl-tRNA hydrolase